MIFFVSVAGLLPLSLQLSKPVFFCTKTLALAMPRHHPSSCIRNSSSSSIFVVVVYYSYVATKDPNNNLVSIRYCGFVGHYLEEAFTFPMQNLLTISCCYYFLLRAKCNFYQYLDSFDYFQFGLLQVLYNQRTNVVYVCI